MSRHEITEQFEHLSGHGGHIRVALNKKKFRLYRNSQAVTATLGLAMTVGFCAFPAMLLYIWIMDPKERNPQIVVPGAVLSLVLPLFVGLATWPAMQIAKALTKTIKEQLPALVIDKEGIWDHSSNYVFGFVPWNEIESVIATSRHAPRLNKDFPGIAFVVKNKNVLLRRKPGLTGSWLNMDAEISNRRQVFIPQGRLEVPVEDLVAQINQFRARVTP